MAIDNVHQFTMVWYVMVSDHGDGAVGDAHHGVVVDVATGFDCIHPDLGGLEPGGIIVLMSNNVHRHPQHYFFFFFPWRASARQCTLTERRMIIIRGRHFQFLISSPSPGFLFLPLAYGAPGPKSSSHRARSEGIFQSPMSPRSSHPSLPSWTSEV